MKTFYRYAASVKPYTVYWDDWLDSFEGESKPTITAATIEPVEGLTLSTPTTDGRAVTFVASGGEPGVTYETRMHIKVDVGPPFEEEVSLRFVTRAT